MTPLEEAIQRTSKIIHERNCSNCAKNSPGFDCNKEYKKVCIKLSGFHSKWQGTQYSETLRDKYNDGLENNKELQKIICTLPYRFFTYKDRLWEIKDAYWTDSPPEYKLFLRHRDVHEPMFRCYSENSIREFTKNEIENNELLYY